MNIQLKNAMAKSPSWEHKPPQANTVEALMSLGLAKNEAKVYEALLRDGEVSAGYIAKKAKIERHNTYDALKRLIEKGLVFEIIQKKENHYQAVEPQKLHEMVEEKSRILSGIMPKLKALYEGQSHREEIYVYRGYEGYKNVLRDILRIGKDYYVIGAAALWGHPILGNCFEDFTREVLRRKIGCHILFIEELKRRENEIIPRFGNDYKFLPCTYVDQPSIDIFGDHVVIYSRSEMTNAEENATLTVIVNPQTAEWFRTIFEILWNSIK